MPRPASSAFISAANALTTNDAFFYLLTIRYTPIGEVWRVVNNMENITSRGNVFTAFPFNLTLPVESGEEVGVATLTIDNIELMLVGLLREATQAPRCDIEVVLASNPDSVEVSIPDLAIRDVTWDAYTIQAKLQNEDILSKVFPPDLYNPQEYAGIFG